VPAGPRNTSTAPIAAVLGDLARWAHGVDLTSVWDLTVHDSHEQYLVQLRAVADTKTVIDQILPGSRVRADCRTGDATLHSHIARHACRIDVTYP